MVIRRVVAPHIDFAALRRELELPERFPPAAQREAEEAAARPPRPVADRTDIPFVTIDPATSTDLDQAMCLLPRAGGGYRVQYAIADVAGFVPPDGALAAETWRRGQTVYLPDGKVSLHPEILSEGAASLLAGQDRPAVLWTIDLDSAGAVVAADVQRALVRSRAKLDYVGVQADADAGRLAEPIALLPELGALLLERGLDRGAINLPMPEQEVEPDGDGWRLTLRAPAAMEDHNAQISLLTGMVAADIMLAGRVGLLRTMPDPAAAAVERLRVAAAALGVDWPAGMSVGRLLTRLDPARPRVAAFLDQAAELMRGAGYTAFDGEVPAEHRHGGVAAAYAHVTAPLRRLADRYATEVCLALHAGTELPEHVRAALPRLPEAMTASDRVASGAERAAVDLTEAVLLRDRVGEVFEAAVVDVAGGDHRDGTGGGDHRDGAAGGDHPDGAGGKHPDNGTGGKRPAGGTVALDDPPVRARCDGDLPLGERVPVRLVTADPAERKVRFARA
ncbi:RNB domain-containing ribonuclease [Plantactinospora siamensis]|uniref:RNB domain-containing ribonuclease n=1 Tax=Plantactinospora siamensis TaxID=555372 RepID=A0ABV6P1I9_9ACTN